MICALARHQAALFKFVLAAGAFMTSHSESASSQIKHPQSAGWRTPTVRRRLRLPDRDHRVRAAFDARLLSDAAVECQSLGPRRIRLRDRVAEFSLGDRAAAGRHDRRPLRHRAGALHRSGALWGRVRADGSCHERADAQRIGRRPDRVRTFRLLVSGGAGRVRKDFTAAMALVRIRTWYGRRLVRSVSLLAACGRPDGSVRLAAGAADLRRQPDRGAAAFARTGDAACRGDEVRFVAIVAAGARRGLRTSFLHAAGAGLFHLRLSASVHHHSHAALSHRPRAVRGGRRLDDRDDRPVQCRRFVDVRLARQPHAEALLALDHLLHAGDGDLRLHLVSGHAVHVHHVRRGHGPDVALDGAAHRTASSL